MSEKNKAGYHVPRLRFPEFREAGDWGEKPIGTLGQTISGLSGKSGVDFGEGQPFVTYKQVFDSAWIDFSKCGRVKIADDERQNTVHHGDVLFTTSSETPDEVGYASVVLNSPPEPTYLNSFCFSFRSNCLHTLKPEFSRYLFHSPIYRKSITVIAQGSTRFNISKSAFLKLSLPIPQGPEQQKIADCLASLDELITLEAQKLDTLKTHKKGLMQQLFPAEGETLPKLRFPEFQDAGEWVIKPLGEIGENLDYRRVPITEQDRIKGEIPYYGASGVIDFVKDFIFDEDLLCISEDGANLVARTYPIAFPISGKSWVNNHAHVMRFEENSTQLIIENYLNSIRLDDFLTGMAQPKLNRAKLDIIPIPLPDPPEQQKIAACLTSLDDLITAQTQKLAALKTHKKGLMQQLFPALDAEVWP